MIIRKNRSDNIGKSEIDRDRHLRLVLDEAGLDEADWAVLPPELTEQPGLLKLVQEYCELANKPELTEADTERMAEIYDLAEYDELLNHWLNKIDDSVEPILVALRQQKGLSLEDFIYNLGRIPSQDMTIEKFKALAKKVRLSTRLVNEHIHFQERDYCRVPICQTSFGAIFVIGWKPEQSSEVHRHANDLSVIRVYQGTLTHKVFDEVEESVDHMGVKGKRTRYVLRDKWQVEEDGWLCVDQGQIHQLVNESQENLVTIHFRYFKQPIKREDEEPGIVTPFHSTESHSG